MDIERFIPFLILIIIWNIIVAKKRKKKKVHPETKVIKEIKKVVRGMTHKEKESIYKELGIKKIRKKKKR